MLNSWQPNLILFLVFNVIFFQFYKLSLKSVRKDGAATIIFQVLAGLSQFLLIPLFGWQTPNTATILLLLLTACIFYAINDRLQTTVRKNLEVSDFSILGQLGTVFLIMYSVTIFHNPLVPSKLVGAGLIIAANTWLFYKPHMAKLGMTRYYVLGAVASLSFATAISIDIGISKHFNLPFYIGLTLLIPACMVAASERIKPRAIREEWDRGNKKYYVVTGLAWGLSILFSLRAFKFGQVGTVVPLEAGAVILNVLAAYLFLKERSHPYKKFIAAVVVVVGVYLTVV